MDLHAISLFSGVGMLDEGLRAGLAHLGISHRTVCHVEREAHAGAVLAARMEEGSLDAAPIWTDVTTFDARAWRGRVDGIVAGFPCQDLSVAGRRAGLDGKRSGLFFEVVRIATDSDAWFLFLENVGGIATATASVVDEAEGELDERAAARVLGELADLGWDAEWITLSASDVGASHGRARWFCFAWRVDHAARHGGDRGGDGEDRCGRGVCQAGDELGHAASDRRRQGRPELRGRPGRSDPAGAGGAVADTGGPRLQERTGGGCDREALPSPGRSESAGLHRALDIFAPGPADAAWSGILGSRPWLAPALSIEEQLNAQAAFAAAQPVLRGMADGLAGGVDFDFRAERLKSCGNGVVALQAAAAFVVLARRSGVMAACRSKVLREAA